MKHFLTIFSILATIICATLVTTSAAYAWGPFSSVDCSGEAASSAVCADRDNADDPVSGSNGIIMKVVNIIAFIAGAAAVIIIVLAGLRMITSGGSSDDVAGARRSLIYAIVGIIVIVLARTIVAFVISAL